MRATSFKETGRIGAAFGLVASLLIHAGCKHPAEATAHASSPPKTLAAFRPPAIEQSPDKVDLGRLLFFDQRLSGDHTMSCATCHDPAKGFADGLKTAKGKNGKTLARNSPSVINIDARAPFFWDGRAATAEEQALGPVGNPDEMGKDVGELVSELAEAPEYVARFKRAYSDGKITGERIGAAIAAFERTLVSANAPIDRFLAGDKTAMSEQAAFGMQLFIGKAECVKCHEGPHLTDAGFHNIGVAGQDIGRYKILPLPILKGAFKTPSLRDVELTPPYFHDGSAVTLRDVVAHYNRGGDTKDNLDPDIRPLSLSDREQDALVAFMKALTGKAPQVEAPRIPHVVASPRFRSTKELMRSAEGMLHQLDNLMVGVEVGRWTEVRKAIAILIADAEELAALRLKVTPARRHDEFKGLLGDLIIDFEQLDLEAVRRDRAKFSAVYEQVRARCDSCHEAFRWTKKQRGQ
jgi:cytochrome c peroxidase